MASANIGRPGSPSKLPIDERSRSALMARLTAPPEGAGATNDRDADFGVHPDDMGEDISQTGAGNTADGGRKRRRKLEKPVMYDRDNDLTAANSRRVRARSPGGGEVSGSSHGSFSGGIPRGPSAFAASAKADVNSPGPASSRAGAGAAAGAASAAGQGAAQAAAGPQPIISGKLDPDFTHAVASRVALPPKVPGSADKPVAGPGAGASSSAPAALGAANQQAAAAPAAASGAASGTPGPQSPELGDPRGTKRIVGAPPAGALSNWLKKATGTGAGGQGDGAGAAGGLGSSQETPAPAPAPSSAATAAPLPMGPPPVVPGSGRGAQMAAAATAALASAGLMPPPAIRGQAQPAGAVALDGRQSTTPATTMMAAGATTPAPAAAPGGPTPKPAAGGNAAARGAAAPAAFAAAAPAPVPAELAGRVRAVEAERNALQIERDRLTDKLAAMEAERNALKQERVDSAQRLAPLLRELAQVDASRKRRELAELQSRVGRWEPIRRAGLNGSSSINVEFSPGTEWRQAETDKVSIEEKLKDIEAKLAVVKKNKTKFTAKNNRAAKASNAAAGGAAPTGKGKKKAAEAAAAAAAANAGDDNDEDEDMEGDDEQGAGAGAGARAAGGPGLAEPNPADIYQELELMEDEERLKCAQAQAKAELAAVTERIEAMVAKKAYMQAELLRQKREDESRLFLHVLRPGMRYLFTSLLGKGGNGEVWKAIDMWSGREVAVKMNMMDPSWNDAKRAHYVTHVLRETDIMKGLRHPNIVEYIDTVNVSEDCLAMVMEYCKGEPLDLDKHLRLAPNGCLPEKEARAILLQILSALRYINGIHASDTLATAQAASSSAAAGAGAGASSSGAGATAQPSILPHDRRIIHYDLKPANILFDEFGTAKVADFGLSKIVEQNSEDEDGGFSMELTSQGAGTLWYLPPECFSKNARISNKVDVFSTGVIFYQMLYGRRPFGEGTKQEEYMQRGQTGLHGWDALSFPDTKDRKVSEEAKDFIRKALVLNVDDRPDVAAICCDPYLRKKLKA